MIVQHNCRDNVIFKSDLHRIFYIHGTEGDSQIIRLITSYLFACNIRNTTDIFNHRFHVQFTELR